MADQWLTDYINQKTVENTGGKPVAKTITAPSPTPPKVSTTPASKVPISTPKQQSRVDPTVHGKLFSGGIVAKAFDVLRLPEYGIVSFAKGVRDTADKYRAEMKAKGIKGVSPVQHYGPKILGEGVVAGVKNIIPGVTNRTQLGREEGDYNLARDVTKNKYIQTGANLATSIALPAAPIGKALSLGGKVISKVPGISKVGGVVAKGGNKIGTIIKESPRLTKTVEGIPGMEYFRNPAAGKILSNADDVAKRRISGLYNQINDTATGLTPQERVTIGELIEGIHKGEAPAKLVQKANYVKSISDDIGKQVVDAGLMSPESFAKFQGKYLAHIADVVKKEEIGSLARKGLKFSSNALKQRKDKLGTAGYPDYIKEFQFPTFKSLAGEVENVESVKAVRQLAEKFGTKAGGQLVKNFRGPRTTQAGQVLLEDVLPAKVGRQFKGVSVPTEVADYISKTYEHIPPSLLDRATNVWKLGKTIYSGPAYHGRNFQSNLILSEASTGEGLPSTIYRYAKAVKTYLGKGKDAKLQGYLQELKDHGVVGRINLSQGAKELSPDVFGKNKSLLKKAIDSPKAFQKANEDTSKLNVYAYFRDHGDDIQTAAKKAEEAIFSPYNISQTEKGIVKNVFPFYSFTRQALPFTAKTALRSGNTLTKYEKAKTAVEGLSPGEGGKLPEGMEGMTRLPIKDKNGKNIYFDTRYIYPWGNFDQEGVPFMRGQGPFGLGLNPFITEGAAQVSNKDLYFGNEIAKSKAPNRALAQRIQHGIQTFGPNILPTDFIGGIPSGQPGINFKARGGSKLYDAFTNQPDYAGRTRSRVQAILDTFGLKTSAVSPDQPKFDASARNKALRAIQAERRSVLQDKRLSAEQKKQIMKDLSEASRQVLTGQQ